MKSKFLIVLIILFLGVFLRFYKLTEIPYGIDSDEASQGYDAYSILKTGKDRYGEAFPIFLRSFGNYQSPLYTYLTILPILVFDLSAFATRFISAASGVVILICTFFLILNFKIPKKFALASISTLLIAISPWSVLFSRTAVEANLALAIFVFAVLLYMHSLKKPGLFIIAGIFLALSTYAYHAERVISIIFLGAFIGLFKKELLKKKKILMLGVVFFLALQIPQFALSSSPAYKTRLSQVQYWNDAYANGGFLSVIRKFSAQYTAYLSPKNLFFDVDEQPIRSMPDLSIFYPWMLISLIFGFKVFLKERSNPGVKILLLVLAISPIPAAITREPFYTLRVLPLFWVMTIIIAYGTYFIIEKIPSLFFRYLFFISLVLFSLALLYNSYFILLKYERMKSFGYYNIQLVKKLEKFKDKKVVLDSERMNLSIWYVFVKKYDPIKLQNSLKSYVSDGYYSSTEFDSAYKIDNLEFRPIFFKAICKDTIIVGDLLSVSDSQAKEHHLEPIFEIKDLNDRLIFKGYQAKSNSSC